MDFSSKDIGLSLARVTELAAMESAAWIGRGDKISADQSAVNGMRKMFDYVDIRGTVVIGEGEKDEAPMLYIGEKIGRAGESDIEVDIAVDPLDGTTSTAKGTENAISVIAVAPKGELLNSRVFYMEKLAVGPKAKDAIDLSKPLKENLENIARALDKDISELTVTIQERERHESYIKTCRELGCKVKLFRDGDVGQAIATCVDESDIDVMVGIGGAPEGVIGAVALKCLGGNIQGRLHAMNDDDRKNNPDDDFERVLTIDDLAGGNSVIFVATGVTDGDLLRGVKKVGDNKIKTHTVIMRGDTGTVRFVETTHNLDKKPGYAVPANHSGQRKK